MSVLRTRNGDDGLPSLPKRQKDEADEKSLGKGGQGASQAASPAQGRTRRRNRMITSCLECRRRKLKCDKSHPCTNCSKLSRDCVFLAPSLDSASQLKLTEIKEKMGSLERVIEQDVAKNGAWREPRKAQQAGQSSMEDEIDFAPIPDDEKELEPTPLAVDDAVYDEDADGDLMDLGVRFGKLWLTDRVGGLFRPKISVSLNDSRNDRRTPEEKIVSSEQPAPRISRPEDPLAVGLTYLPPAANFFFSSTSVGASLIGYLPAQSTADHLLRQYWHAVHPIARVVHRPSFQRRYNAFWEQVRRGIEPAGSLQAIVFAAIFSAAVSLPEERVLNDFAVSKKELVDNFQQGAETALGRANLLRTTKLETIQAMVMYMIPLCRDTMSRAHSALVGATIRLAECMGLHRDGSAYGMSPVEIHVRRLVWYQIGILDIRTCEAQGPRPGIREGEFDTKFPLNVDDNDLESSNPPIRSRDHWTDMTFTLIRMECVEMTRAIWFDRPKLETKQMSLTGLLGKIENFRKALDAKYSHLMDKSIPVQQAASLLMSISVNRLYITILHSYHSSVAARMPDRLRQIFITTGTDLIESAMLFETLPSVQPWSWFSGALQQYQTAILLLAEVFMYPMRREADRIWTVLDYVFEVPPNLGRDEKARLILTEIRDRMDAYRNARKPRPSVAMNRRVGQVAPRLKGDFGLSLGRADAALPRELGGQTDTSAALPDREYLHATEEQQPTRELWFPGPNETMHAPGPMFTHAPVPASGFMGTPWGGYMSLSMLSARATAAPTSGAGFAGAESSSANGGGGGGDQDGFSSSGASAAATMGAGSVTDWSSVTDELMPDIDWNEWDKLFPPDTNTGELNVPMSLSASTGPETFGMAAMRGF